MNQKKQTIMIVEDEEMLLHAISTKLTLNGYLALPYLDGKMGMADLISKKIYPDIIWLDYYLSNMTGMEFVNELKTHAIEIPVVIVSNSASDTKVKTMLALGVKKYILKAHHRLDEIIAELQQLLPQLNV